MHRAHRHIRMMGLWLVAMHTIGCASFGSMRPGPEGWNRDVLTSQELMADRGPSAYDSAERLRPFFLIGAENHSRGQAPELPTSHPLVVYVNMFRMGGIDALRNIPTSSVSSIRYVRPSDAMTRFGSGHNGGVIVVELRDKASR